MNYWNGSAWFSLPPGTDGQVLTIAQGVPTWSADNILSNIGSFSSSAGSFNGSGGQGIKYIINY